MWIALFTLRVQVNNFYLVPKRVLVGLIGVLGNGGGLGTGDPT